MNVLAWWLPLLVVALQTPRDLAPGEALGNSQISGVVTAADSPQTLLRGAIVTATIDGLSRSTVTDEQGRFQFNELPAGRVMVSARKPGFVTAAFGARRAGQPGVPIVIGPQQHASGVTIALPRGAVVTGTIRDSHGAPAANVAVTAMRVSQGASVGNLAAPAPAGALSDDRGMYRLFDLAPGDYVLIAMPPVGFMSGAVGARPASEIDAIFQRLQQRSRTTAPGVQPIARPTAGREFPATAFAYVPVYYPGTAAAAEAERVRVAAGDERSGVDIVVRLVRAMTIDGTIGHAGGAVPALTVSITPDEPVGRLPVFPQPGTAPSLAIRPGAEGRFQYINVPPGRYTITARTTGEARLWALTEVVLTTEDVAGLSLVLQPALRVAGRVTVDREPGHAGDLDLTSVLVTVRRNGPSYSSMMNGTAMGIPGVGSAHARADGTFEIEGVFPGEYQITATVKSSAGWRVQSAATGGRDMLDGFSITTGISDVALTITNRRTVFEGRFHPPAGRAAADYFVLAFPADRALWRAGSRRVQFTRPSTAGDFVIRDLPAGQYRVAALTDLDPDQITNPAFLEQALGSSITFGLGEGQTVRQDLKVN